MYKPVSELQLSYQPSSLLIHEMSVKKSSTNLRSTKLDATPKPYYSKIGLHGGSSTKRCNPQLSQIENTPVLYSPASKIPKTARGRDTSTSRNSKSPRKSSVKSKEPILLKAMQATGYEPDSSIKPDASSRLDTMPSCISPRTGVLPVTLSRDVGGLLQLTTSIFASISPKAGIDLSNSKDVSAKKQSKIITNGKIESWRSEYRSVTSPDSDDQNFCLSSRAAAPLCKDSHTEVRRNTSCEKDQALHQSIQKFLGVKSPVRAFSPSINLSQSSTKKKPNKRGNIVSIFLNQEDERENALDSMSPKTLRVNGREFPLAEINLELDNYPLTSAPARSVKVPITQKEVANKEASACPPSQFPTRKKRNAELPKCNKSVALERAKPLSFFQFMFDTKAFIKGNPNLQTAMKSFQSLIDQQRKVLLLNGEEFQWLPQPALKDDEYAKLPPRHAGLKKTIVFDLDETLVHCKKELTGSHDTLLSFRLSEAGPITVAVNIRPFAREVLAELSTDCEIVIFTSSERSYADAVINYLDPDSMFISHRFYREHCSKTTNGLSVKDLRMLTLRNLEDLIIIDNTPTAYLLQNGNGIPIAPFTDDKADEELVHLYKFLKKITDAPDVRDEIRLALKLDMFRAFIPSSSSYEDLFASLVTS